MEVDLDRGPTRLALSDLELRLAVAVLESRSHHLGHGRPGERLRAAEFDRLSAHAFEVHLVVLTGNRAGFANVHDASVLHQQCPIAEALYRAHVMGDEYDRSPSLLEARELVEALLLEGDIAHRKHLIDQQ